MNESYKPEFIELKKWLKDRKFEDTNLIPACFPGKVWHQLSGLRSHERRVGPGDRKARVVHEGGLCSLWEHIFCFVSDFLPCSYNIYLYLLCSKNKLKWFLGRNSKMVK